MNKPLWSGRADVSLRTARSGVDVSIPALRAYDRRGASGGTLTSVGAVLVLGLAAYGCANPGSEFGSGGSTGQPSGTGGSNVSPGTGGSGTGTGGAVGTGGSSLGTGGSASTGGAMGSGGGVGTGGNVGTGGALGSTGGRAGTGGTGGAPAGTGGAAPGTGGAAAVCPKPAGQICHEFVANDNARCVVNYVNEFDPTKNWTKPVTIDTTQNSPRTIEIVNNPMAKTGKAILVSVDTGYWELDLVDGTRLVAVAGRTGITGACRIVAADGTNTTALANNNQIIVVSTAGTTVRTIPLPPGANLRAINRDPATGNYWFSKDNLVYGITDPQGAVVFMANMGVGTKGYAVWWRAGGGVYATTGDPSTVEEINAAGQILNTIGGKGATFPFLDFFSGFVRLPASGDYVVANWLGHLAAPSPTAPEILEFTPQNTIVWQWGNQTLARQITNVFVIR